MPYSSSPLTKIQNCHRFNLPNKSAENRPIPVIIGTVIPMYILNNKVVTLPTSLESTQSCFVRIQIKSQQWPLYLNSTITLAGEKT